MFTENTPQNNASSGYAGLFFGTGSLAVISYLFILCVLMVLPGCQKKEEIEQANNRCEEADIQWVNDSFGWKVDAKNELILYSKTDTVVLPNTEISAKDKYSGEKQTSLPWSGQSKKITKISVRDKKSVRLDANSAGLFLDMEELESIDIPYFDCSECEDMSYFFSGCRKLRSFDFSAFDTRKVKNMSHMFSDCAYLRADISELNTSAVEDMSGMFAGCCFYPAENDRWTNGSIKGIEKINTGNVKDMSLMFSMADYLAPDALSKFNTEKCENMERMFEGCSFCEDNDATKPAKMLDLTHYNTSKVTNFTAMFYACNVESLDISNFDFSSAVRIDEMFCCCRNLVTVTTGNVEMPDLEDASSLDRIFEGCDNISKESLNNFGIG